MSSWLFGQVVSRLRMSRTVECVGKEHCREAHRHKDQQIVPASKSEPFTPPKKNMWLIYSGQIEIVSSVTSQEVFFLALLCDAQDPFSETLKGTGWLGRTSGRG